MSLIKISAVLLGAVGAKSDAEFSDCLSNTLASMKAAIEKSDTALTEASASIKTLTESSKTLSESLAAANTKLLSLENAVGNPAAMTEGKIREIAESAGSKSAVEAVGAIGAGSPVAKPSTGSIVKPVEAAKDFAAIVADNVLAGKSKTDAIVAAVKSNPVEHAAFVAIGGKL